MIGVQSQGAVLITMTVSDVCCCLYVAGSLEEFTKEILSTGVELLITDDGDSQRLAALTLLSSQLALPLLVSFTHTLLWACDTSGSSRD